MVECKFCEKEFESEREMHLHWGDEHEDELSSHQEEKLKKAEREKQEEKEKKMSRRKKLAGQGLAVLAAVGILTALGPQLLSSMGGGETVSFENLTGEPVKGNVNASVTVVEFGDYRCPFCKQWHESVYPQLKRNYINTGEANYIFINYAFLDSGFPGRTSTRASIAGECVLEQDEKQFWNFHDALYSNQGAENEDWATQDVLMQLARDNTDGLDYSQLQQCISNEKTLDKVQEDKSIGNSKGVSGTPTVFVNGKEVPNAMDYNSIKAAINSHLN